MLSDCGIYFGILTEKCSPLIWDFVMIPGPTFISVAMTKYPDKKQLLDNSEFGSQCQVVVHHYRDFKARIRSSSSHPQFRAEKIDACMLT